MVTFGDIGRATWILFGISILAFALFLLLYIILHILIWILPIDRRISKVVLYSAGNGLPLALVGMVAGFLTGSSRQPAVQALIPATLTLVGVIIVYLIGRSRVRAPVAGFAISVFALALLGGTAVGAASRIRNQEIENSIEALKNRSDRELIIRLHREAIGLPPEMDEFKINNE